ncbi:MAG TPA: HemK/PrmC family methyltransferase [Kofleriaceae bacterium]
MPRTETELAARTAIERAGARFVDVCCGTGNLACAIAAARPDARGWALDLTEPCVELARRNLTRLGFADRVEVRQGDLFAPLAPDSLAGTIDLIVCNPPYISTSKLATRDDLTGEPREAFDGGPYGVSIHQRVARDARALLKPGGWLVFEFGLGQERQLQLVFQRAGGYDEVTMIANDEGAPRVVAARLARTPKVSK